MGPKWCKNRTRISKNRGALVTRMDCRSHRDPGGEEANRGSILLIIVNSPLPKNCMENWSLGEASVACKVEGICIGCCHLPKGYFILLFLQLYLSIKGLERKPPQALLNPCKSCFFFCCLSPFQLQKPQIMEDGTHAKHFHHPAFQKACNASYQKKSP